MKKIILTSILILLVSLMVVNTVFAAPGKPIGTCKPGWKLVSLPLNSSSKADKNKDGFVCTSFFVRSGHYIDNFNRKCIPW